MDKKEFNIILQECLINHGFILKNKNFYKSTDNLIVAVGTQKSNYDNSIFINFAVFVKDIHTEIDYPKVQEGDIRGRFQYDINGRVWDDYPLSELNKLELQKSLEKNLQTIINPLFEGGLKMYFDIYPKAIFTATKRFKEYLNNNPLQ